MVDSRACIIKLNTAVIYSFHNKLECLSLNTRLGWKNLAGTNTIQLNMKTVNYGRNKFYDAGTWTLISDQAMLQVSWKADRLQNRTAKTHNKIGRVNVA